MRKPSNHDQREGYDRATVSIFLRKHNRDSGKIEKQENNKKKSKKIKIEKQSIVMMERGTNYLVEHPGICFYWRFPGDTSPAH